MAQRNVLESARHIVVEGPIGVGKTSLARRLASHLEAQTSLEQPELNPFLTFLSGSGAPCTADTAVLPVPAHGPVARTGPAGISSAAASSSITLLEKDPIFARLTLVR